MTHIDELQRRLTRLNTFVPRPVTRAENTLDPQRLIRSLNNQELATLKSDLVQVKEQGLGETFSLSEWLAAHKKDVTW